MFEKDLQAKTDSYFAIDNFPSISHQMISDIKEQAKKKNETVRLCLHRSPNSLLHFMLIYHPYQKIIPIQKFLEQESMYMIKEGMLRINILDEDLHVIKTITLSKEDDFICYIPPNVFYSVEIISKDVMLIEVRTGPFKREKQVLIS